MSKMKTIFRFKKKKHPPDKESVLSVGYELKDKDLGKLHKAASVGNLAKVKQLAKKNDINQLDKEKRTALHIACALGHVEVVQFLIESKAKLNLFDNQNRSALMKAAQGQHDQCLTMLLENHAEPNIVDINGITALHLAASIPSISTAALLLEHEADINAQDKKGFTPLMVSVWKDHIEMAEFLLQEGADVNVSDQSLRSPLIIAAGSGQIRMLRLLLQFNADITLKDDGGRSANDHAVMNGHHSCSVLIVGQIANEDDGPSVSHHGPHKKKQKTQLGSAFHGVDTGLILAGPATDKNVCEDNSKLEPLSLHSTSSLDKWSSEEHEAKKVNVKEMIASERGAASVLPVGSQSDKESEPKRENRVQNPSISFHPKAPQMTSTPYTSYRTDEDDQGDVSDKNDQSEASRKPVNATTPVPHTEVSKDKKRDFLSVLSMEMEEDELDSLDSEPNFENPNMPHEGNQSLHTQDQEKNTTVEEEVKKNVADYNSASITCKKTLPEHKMPSPGHEELPECSYRHVKEQDEDVTPAGPLTPQRNFSSNNTLPTPQPNPQSRARTWPQQTNSEEESDREPDNCTGRGLGSMPRSFSHFSGSPELPSVASGRQRKVQSDKQQRKVGKALTKTVKKVQKSTLSWDTAGTAEKPESRLESLKSQAGVFHQEQQPVGTKSTNEAPVHLQQTYSSNRQGQQPVEEPSQPEMVRGTWQFRASQTNTYVKGKPLPLTDDSSSSCLSSNEDEARFSPRGPHKSKNFEEVEMMEDFDEITQSSDTLTDDINPPTSGFRQAALILDRLVTNNFDKESVIWLQERLHQYESALENARCRQGHWEEKVSQLKTENKELESRLREDKDVKSVLERNQQKLRDEVKQLKCQLKQEQENCHEATMKFEAKRDELGRMMEQHELEVEKREKVEVTLSNVEQAKKMLDGQIQQLIAKHSETERLLANERTAWMLKENQLNNDLRKQQEIEEENKRNISRINKQADKEKELVQQNSTLQERLTTLRAELDRLHDSSKIKENYLQQENEHLNDQLEVTQQELTTLKCKYDMMASHLENEQQTCVTLKGEIASLIEEVSSLEKEKVGLLKDLDGLKRKLEEKEDQLSTAAQQHQEALSAIKQLEETIQRLEMKNAKLKADVKQQAEKIEALEKAAQEAAMIQKQNELSLATMAMRLEELEKEKGDLISQVEKEQKNVKKMRELKKNVEARMDEEMKRNATLHKEMFRLRSLVKCAKNKLRAKQARGFSGSSQQTDLVRHRQFDDALGEMNEKVEDLQKQLQKEGCHCSQLEKENIKLKSEVASLNHMSHRLDKLVRCKEQLEREVRRLETAQKEQEQMKQFCRDVEERAGQELNEKLWQVNMFLQSRAVSQDEENQIRATHEANMQEKIRQLEGELSRIRTTHKDSLDQMRIDQGQCRQRLTNEESLNKVLTAKLERANRRIMKAESELLNKHSTPMITSVANIRLGGPPLEVNSPARYGASVGPLNRTDGHNREVQSDLDRNISRELNKDPVASACMSMVGSASRMEVNPVNKAKQDYCAHLSGVT